MTRRAALIAATLVTLAAAACTPADVHRWLLLRNPGDPVTLEAIHSGADLGRALICSGRSDVIVEASINAGIDLGLAAQPWTPVECTAEELVRGHAARYGVDPDLAWLIVRCESGGRPDAENPTSTATGLAQFLDGTWTSTVRAMAAEGLISPDAVVTDPQAHAHALAWLLARDGTRPWNASSSCWR